MSIALARWQSHQGPWTRALVRHRLRRSLWAAVAISCCGIILVAIAPVSVGGRDSYVVTDGISMLPRFHADGLVVTRTQSHYHVGEVVAYRNRDLRSIVMHRIVGRDGERFIFKGDNNNFRDRYHPTQAELVGKEWIYVPGAGRFLLWLRSPAVFGVIVAAIALLSFRGQERVRGRRRHHAR